MYIYIYESTPPPPTHTHTLGIHVRLSAPGFGAHRICACADPVFHFFSSAYFTEGPICLGPLPVSFILTENYRLVLVLIALWEAYAWCAKICLSSCGYPGSEIVWITCWLVCGWAWSDMVLWRFGGASTDRLVLYWKCSGILACIRGRGQGSLDPHENRRNIVFPCNAGPVKNHKVADLAFNVGPSSVCQQIQWNFAGGLMSSR